VLQPGALSRSVDLPAGATWADWWTGERHAGGQTIEVPAPWGRPPLLVREGVAIPLNIAEQGFDHRADRRAFALFAPEAGGFTALCQEDDGETEDWRGGGFGEWRLDVGATPERIDVACRATGLRPPVGPVALLVRPSERRPLFLKDGRALAPALFGDWLRREIA
jgi:alpha-glucosidase